MSYLKLDIEKQKYGNKIVLENICQDYETGYIHGFLGENGAGKTTLFHCMANIIPYKGQQMLSDKVRFGYLPTELYMYPMITGDEFLAFYVSAKGGRLNKEEKNELNDLFDLPLKEYADTYSTGMLKKLYLLGLLLQHNDVLLLDEPFNGLDFKSSAFVTALINSMKTKGHTIFVASHDVNHLLSYADTLSVITNQNFIFYSNREMYSEIKRNIEQEAYQKIEKVKDLL